MTLKRIATVVLGAVLGATFLTSGCGGDNGGPGLIDPSVILLNASADGPLAFFFNDDPQGGTIPYRGKSGVITIPFIDGAEGAYDVSLENPDRSVEWDRQAHLFDRDTTAFVAAIGMKDPLGEDLKRLRILFFSPDRTAPIGNRARLFILHGFNRRKGFDTPSLILQTFGDDPQFQSQPVAYGNFTTLEVDSGTYKTNANPALDNHWTAKDADADGVYAENTDVTLKPGALYVVMLSGVEDPNPLVRQHIEFVEIPAKAP